MVFSSVLFLFWFLPCMLAVYFISPRRYRNGVLFVGSLFFYAWGEPRYVLIMLFSTVVDFSHGWLIEKYRDRPALARAFLIFSVVINLSVLGFFKYYNFVAGSILAPLGVPAPNWNIPLPIGISFYTFQTMSYTIDVYRRHIGVQRNIINFGTFVALFPQLIAGPIVRYAEIADELDNPNRESVDKFALGIRRFLVGLGKKVLLANNIGLLWDLVKAQPVGELSVLTAWMGIIAYAFQIYFDFSGYSDMAIGLGGMFGFSFPENFNYPYISRSITEFWRRWHMTLSGWFREYVYIPLGGNRRGLKIQIRNILIVWLLTGLWHGAGWNFIAWGLYFGLILLLEKVVLLRILDKTPKILQHVYALLLILGGWVLFSLDSLPLSMQYFGAMFGLLGGPLFDQFFLYEGMKFLPFLLAGLLASTPLFQILSRKKWARWAAPAGLMLFLLLCTAFLVDASYNPFLYFRF